MISEGARGIPLFVVAGVISMPFALVIDVIKIPVQSVRTYTFSEERIDRALRDLKKARELGYKDTDWHPDSMVSPRRKHLDTLGFKPKKESEQYPAGDGLKAAPLD
jgi:hypothetical protein